MKNKNIRKGWHYIETWNDLSFLAYVTTFLFISIAPWQSWLDHVGTTPPPDMEEELMMEVWRLLKNEEEGGLFLWL